MDGPTHSEVSVRPAQIADIAAVLALWERARSPTARTADDHNTVVRLIEDSADALLVAEREGRVLGVLVAAWDGWRDNMYRLAVAPESRRRGIARQLVQAGHARLQAKGAKRITALVAEQDTEATALWRAAGYERDENLVRFVRDL